MHTEKKLAAAIRQGKTLELAGQRPMQYRPTGRTAYRNQLGYRFTLRTLLTHLVSKQEAGFNVEIRQG